MNQYQTLALRVGQCLFEGLNQIVSERAHGLLSGALDRLDDPVDRAPLRRAKVRPGGLRIAEKRIDLQTRASKLNYL